MSKVIDEIRREVFGGGSTGITPTGTKTITENGSHDVTDYATAAVNVPPYGEGSVNISTNGTHDVSGKASAVVNVPNPSTGTKEITTNGVHDVTDYASADVAVPPYGEGSVTINANGEHDVSGKATAVVNVPNPSTGTKQITTNGTHDVADYAAAEVNVPNPSTGTLYAENNDIFDVRSYAYVDVDVPPYGQGSVTINENGSHDVSGKATAVVAVPQGITPSGSLEISANGTYDVTQKASAVVSVPNDFLPAPADGYTVYTNGYNNQGVVRSFGNFSTAIAVYMSNVDGIHVGDKICVTGTCRDVQSERYAVWGTVTQVNTGASNRGVRLQVAGSSVKNGQENTMVATVNGTYRSKGVTLVEVAVDTPTATTLYVDTNGTYNAPTGYVYDTVEVNVGGGGGASGDLIVNSEGDWLFDILSFTSMNPSATDIRVCAGDNWDGFVTRDYSKFSDPYASASVDIQDLKVNGYVDIPLSNLTGYDWVMINVYDSFSA